MSSQFSRRVAALTGSALATAIVMAGAAAPAGADCRNVWAPSPEGGQLILVCDGDTGDGGDSSPAKGKEKKRKKPPPQFGAIALNPIPVDGSYTGTTTAGFRTKAKARKRALRSCARETGGVCRTMATTKRNGWAVLVAAGGPGGVPQFFSGTGKSHVAAQRLAESRAEAALGTSRTGPTQLVVGVDARARKGR
jgi:hypothetical protein